MRRFALALLALGVLAAPAFADDSQNRAAPDLPIAVLSKPYVATLGDMIAFTMSQYAQVQKSREGWGAVDASVVVTYDHDSGKLHFAIYGNVGSTPVDEARRTLDMFREHYLPTMVWAVTREYHVNIAESDITLVFRNRTTMKEVLRREDSRYLVAE